MTFDWIDRKKEGVESFSRSNLSVTDILSKNQFQLHIDISCPTDALTGAFCVEKPIFKVPSMNCPKNEIMLSIDECGPICELENNCLKQCKENKEDKFFWKKKKGKNLIKSCKWLSKYKKKKQVCKKNVEHIPGYGAAQDICQATCSSCEACYENENSVIYLGKKKKEGLRHVTTLEKNQTNLLRNIVKGVS